MQLYIYRWDYHEGTIWGSASEGLLRVKGFVPWKMVKGSRYTFKTLQGSKPVRVNKVPGMHPEALLQFLAHRHLSHTGWVEVPDWTCTVEEITPVDSHALPELHVLAFDIETYSSTGQFPDPTRSEDVIICIGTVSSLHGPRTFTGEESAMVHAFYHYLRSAHIVVGYNTHGFDWRYLLERHGLPATGTQNLPWQWEKACWSSSACQRVDVSYPSVPGLLVVDLYHYCKRTFKIEDYRLNTVATHFGLGGKHELSYTDIWEAWEQGTLEEVIAYCEHDCQLVLDIMQRCGMLHGLLALAQVTHTPVETLFTRGQQVRVKNLLYVECVKHQFLPTFTYRKAVPYEGATVIEPQPGLYDHCACMDFASLYPSILISENICYSTYDPITGTFDKTRFGIVPNLVKRLIAERERMRHQPSYANALKISTNSIYGVFGASGELNLTAAAATVTRVGRESLQRAVDHLHQLGYRVIYGDTDSCIYTGDRPLTLEEHQALAASVTALFQAPIRMQFEAEFQRFLVIGKKMYIVLEGKDRLRYKGVMAARREACAFSAAFYREVTRRVMMGEPFRDYCRECIRSLRSQPREAFVLKKTYNGPYKSPNYPLEVYHRRFGPLASGETFFVIVSHGSTLGDRLRPAASEAPIDYLWYLAHLVNPIDAVMAAAGKVFRLANNVDLFE